MEESLIQVHRFFSKYIPAADTDRRKKGELDEVDFVEYGPLGSADRSRNIARVDMISRVLDGKANNPAIAMAKARWAAIEPRYKAWKDGQNVDVEGTPLAAWNALSNEQADKLRVHGVHTVEEVAKLTDVHVSRLGLPNMRNLIAMAKKYEASKDTAAFTVALEEKDKQIANLMAKVDELADIVAAGPSSDGAAKAEPRPKRRGRPRTKVEVDEPADNHSNGG